MRGLRDIFHKASALDRALRRGDVRALQAILDAGQNPVALYDRARELRRVHPKSLDLLERDIEDWAMIPGDHVPRHANWKIKR